MNKQIKKTEVYEAPEVCAFAIQAHSCIAVSLSGSTEEVSGEDIGSNESYDEIDGIW